MIEKPISVSIIVCFHISKTAPLLGWVENAPKKREKKEEMNEKKEKSK